MSDSARVFQEKLLEALSDAASCGSVLIGLSGGLDSVVLLHTLAELRTQSKIKCHLRALHVNHQLQDKADAWQQHCQNICARLDVEFSSIKVSISVTSGLENAARDARYQAFEEALKPGEVLLLAHHRDDQMETLLLRLMRGSGSRGLSAMPRSRSLGKGSLLRPMLEFDRQMLQQYAEEAQLQWVEDDSNQDELFDRNYCRHKLLPVIESRWPSFRESWSKSAVLAQENECLLQELAAMDLQAAMPDSNGLIRIEKLLALSEPRRRNLLRYWLTALGMPEPGWNRLQQLSKQVLKCDANTRFVGEDYVLHCYRNNLYALRTDDFDMAAALCNGAEGWNPSVSAEITLVGNGTLTADNIEGAGLALSKRDALQIRYRQGGEVCRLAGRPTKALKKILQEADIEPWLRRRIPLLYKDDALVCIPGVGVSEGFAAAEGESGLLMKWRRPDLQIHLKRS